MATTILVTTLPCPECGKRSEITVDSESYNKFQSGMFVQDAFPNMNSDERELLITGTHPACWDAMFPDEEE